MLIQDSFTEPKQENTNYALISGEIVSEAVYSHTVYNENFVSFYVQVNRLSNKYDTLQVIASDKLISDLYEIGGMVEILGQVRTHNSFCPIENKKKLILYIFSKEINFIDDFEHRNDVNLEGFLCKPPLYRTTPFGREICDIMLAVNRNFNKSDYIPCITWGKTASLASTLEVGEKISISGRMQSRTYAKRVDDDTVIEKTAYEVSIYKFF